MTAEAKAQDIALYRGGYGGILADRVSDQALAPVNGLALFGWETLGLFPARNGGVAGPAS